MRFREFIRSWPAYRQLTGGRKRSAAAHRDRGGEGPIYRPHVVPTGQYDSTAVRCPGGSISAITVGAGRTKFAAERGGIIGR